MPSQELPPLSQLKFDPDGLSVWRMLLAAEAFALNSSPTRYNDTVIGVRVVGFFLRDFWDHSHLGFGSTPYRRLVLAISSCNAMGNHPPGSLQQVQDRNEAIIALGLRLRNYLMRLFRSNTWPTPPSSTRSPYPSFEVHKSEMIKAMAKTDKTKKEVKEQALERDGYACMITGLFDRVSVRRYPEVREKAESGRGIATTQCAHLFSESAQSSNDPEYAATSFAMLSLFGLDEQVRRLLGGQVNSLHNVFTMTMQMHLSFDQYELWLEEVPGTTNTYDVCSYDDVFFKYHEKPPRRVTFRVDPAVVAECEREGIPPPDLPDRTLIAIRSVCARVAHLSGAVEQMDQVQQDVEATMVMANDGSTADLLGSLLLQHIECGAKQGIESYLRGT
ncbi:hypothetical protein BV22DRAFT_1038422 [Leucogyrophana mollusca]|uniref:Uncharacterized protein n=1 Tax=Leucogyrophana mollusca TaxID=85980 RepID=A0ACB8B7C1_9AGAM|nr:hypothetical protein BV22DRAFT_1038422 [Leucogyrophana mollusca]